MTMKPSINRQIMDNSPNPVYWMDVNGRVVYANPAACLHSGYSCEDILRLSVDDFDKHLPVNGWADIYGKIRSGLLDSRDTLFITKNGEEYPVSISYFPSDDSAEPLICAFVRRYIEGNHDTLISVRLKHAVDKTTADAVYFTDDKGRIHYVNNSACRLLGYDRRELLSMNIYDIDISINTNTEIEAHKRLMREESGIFETRYQRKDGTVFPVEISYSNIMSDENQYSFSFARDITTRKETEKRYEELSFAIDNAIDAVYLFDETGRIFYVNKTACKALGYKSDELTSMNILDFNPGLTRKEWRRHLREVRKGDFPPFEVVHERKDGFRFPVEITTSAGFFDGSEYFCAVVRDITDRIEAERRSRELNFIIDNAKDAVYTYDYDGRIRYANMIAAEETGYSRDELMKMRIMDIDPDLTSEMWKEGWRRARQGGRQILVSRHRRKDGTTYPVEISQGITIIDGNEYSCAFVRDITERKKAEKRNEELTFAMENAIDAVYLNDDDGNIYYANQAACQSLGYTYDELTSMNIGDIDLNFSRDVLKLIKEGRADEIPSPPPESFHRRKDGTVFPVEVSFNSQVIDGTNYYCSFVRDITEQKNTRSENEILRAAIDNAMDAVYVFDGEGKILYANRSASRELGYSIDELENMSIVDIDPSISESPDREALRKERWEGSLQGEEVIFETSHSRKDGSTFPVECSHNGIRLNDQDVGISFVRNITERKKELRQNDELRFAIENSIDAVYLANRSGEIYYVNQSACLMLGYSYDELVSMTIYDIDPHITREHFKSQWSEEWQNTITTFETVHRRKDGSEFPVEVSSRVTEFEGSQYACSFTRDITERKEEERQLLFLQFAIESAGDAIFITSTDGDILYANQSACDSLGYSRDELLQLKVPEINPEIDRLSKDIRIWETATDGIPNIVESVHKRKDGSTFPIEIQSRVVHFGGSTYSCAVVRDITERKRVQASLQESEERFRIIAETSPVALLISRVHDGLILYANRQVEMLFGKPASEIMNSSIYRLFNATDNANELIDLMRSNEHIYSHEMNVRKEDGTELWFSLNARSIMLHGEEVICSALLDITESHNLAEQLSYQASYDVLTNLVNRREFQNHLQRVLTHARQNQTENALCFLDLDQFKIINDTCGHIAGDELLRQLGQLLQENIRKRDILARLGGDEFAILLENCNLHQAERVANAIRQSVQDFRFHWEDHTFNIGVSIGMVPIDFRSETVTDVLRRADTACYAAKDMGRNRIHIYHANDEELVKRRGEMQWISRINEALEENRLQLWGQKIIPLNPSDENGDHYEFLLRLQDRDGSIVPPGSFLPTAERYGIAPRIDRWVITTILNWYSQNPKQLEKLGLCSINLSGQSLSEEELLNYIINYFETSSLPAHKFCFEITETAAIANLAYATHFIKSLKELGCRFALDDFGSGLSSFAYLKNLPVDFIKIDGLFVKDILDDPIDLAMVKSINEIGHVMNKITIAEFVESREIQEKLREVGVDYAQGYGIDRPAPLINASDVQKIYK